MYISYIYLIIGVLQYKANTLLLWLGKKYRIIFLKEVSAFTLYLVHMFQFIRFLIKETLNATRPIVFWNQQQTHMTICIMLCINKAVFISQRSFAFSGEMFEIWIKTVKFHIFENEKLFVEIGSLQTELFFINLGIIQWLLFDAAGLGELNTCILY